MDKFFGEVVLSAGYWWIKCEPQVRSRLKRVFARAPQEAADRIRISNSPENARDLEWFLERYPMKVKQAALLRTAADEHRDQEVRLAELLAMRAPPIDVQLAEPPRDYQVVVPQFLEIKKGMLLGDDVGVGKTVSGMCCMTLASALPAVVVCPPHLMSHWEGFLRRFLPALTTHKVKKGKPYSLVNEHARQRKQGALIEPRIPDVIIITYHRLRGWAETLAELCPTVIFEECQQLRNPSSEIYQACVHMSAKVQRRLGLSATPIYNYGSEFFWVVDALQPGALGTREEFVREWCTAKGGDKARLKDPEEFGAYLRREGIMLRRSRKDVGRELPPVTKIIHEIEADAEVLKNLTGDAIALAKIILSSNERYRGEHMKASGEFDMIMRQATGIAKAPYVAQFVRMLIESGEKVILFGWHKAVYKIWKEALAEFKPAFYTGAQSPREKDVAKADFIEGRTNLLILSLRAGAGTDGLQKVCRTAVIGELDWSQGVHTQCLGRIDRDGQDDYVTGYFLVANDGSDPIVSEVCGVKRSQIEPVLNPDAPIVERIDTGVSNLRQLARAFLAKRGQEVPVEREPEPINA